MIPTPQAALDRLIREAHQLRQSRETTWRDYEHFKRKIASLVGHGDDYEPAIRKLCDALDL